MRICSHAWDAIQGLCPRGGLLLAVPISLLLLEGLPAAGCHRSMPVGADGDRPRAGRARRLTCSSLPSDELSRDPPGAAQAAGVCSSRGLASGSRDISLQGTPRGLFEDVVFSTIEVFTGSTSQSCAKRGGCHGCDTFNPLQDECERWSTVPMTSSPV